MLPFKMVRTSLVRLSNRIPSIKFRKGYTAGTAQDTPSPAAWEQHVTSTSAPIVSNAVRRNIVLEDWQLPFQFKRQPLKPDEIEAINSGVYVS